MPARSRYSGRKKNKTHTHEPVWTHDSNTLQKRTDLPTHNPVLEQYNSGTYYSSDAHEAIHPPTMCYAAVQQKTYSSSIDVYPARTHTALHRRERVVKPPWVQKTKVRNTSNTHSHGHTRSSSHPLTDAPTYPRTTCYSNTAEQMR